LVTVLNNTGDKVTSGIADTGGKFSAKRHPDHLKVHKNENFFGFDFEICTVSLLVMHKYEGFVKKIFIGP
jgi:hypothetical protein